MSEMQKETIRLAILGGILVVASVIQFLGASFGVIPNFVLATIVIAALFLGDIWHELLLLAVALFLLKFSPAVDRELVAFFATGLLIIGAARRLPWHRFINGIWLTVCAITVLYALVDPTLIFSFIFAQELVYTVLVMSVLYYGLMTMRLFRNVR